MPSEDIRAKKEQYAEKLLKLVADYQSVLICNVDNVGSNQMHQIRLQLRGQGVLLMGKNTMIRKVLRQAVADKPAIEKIIQLVRGNICMVFTNGDLREIRTLLTSNRVRAPAKSGAIAPGDVKVPAGNTGMEPGKTSFFQALGIPTKISRGTIEIVSDVNLVAAGTKVGPSEAALLNMLNISPFTYGLTVKHIFEDGIVYDPSILDVTDEDLIEQIMSTASQLAGLSLATGMPSVVAVPHLIVNNYKNLVGLSLASDYCIEAVSEVSVFIGGI